MQTYLIDAFNLLHKIAPLEGSASPHEDLIRYIRAKGLTGSANNRVITVRPSAGPGSSFHRPARGAHKSLKALTQIKTSLPPR